MQRSCGLKTGREGICNYRVTDKEKIGVKMLYFFNLIFVISESLSFAKFLMTQFERKIS